MQPNRMSSTKPVSLQILFFSVIGLDASEKMNPLFWFFFFYIYYQI